MTKKFKQLMRQQVQSVTSSFESVAKIPPFQEGWIKTMRKALGMSSLALAKRFKSLPSNILRMEKREVQGTITLEKLQEVAAAMDCKLVYALVPLEPIETLRKKQADIIAQKKINPSNHSMKLEDQGLNMTQLQQKKMRLVEELLNGNSKKLWDDDGI